MHCLEGEGMGSIPGYIEQDFSLLHNIAWALTRSDLYLLIKSPMCAYEYLSQTKNSSFSSWPSCFGSPSQSPDVAYHFHNLVAGSGAGRVSKFVVHTFLTPKAVCLVKGPICAVDASKCMNINMLTKCPLTLVLFL